MHIFKILFKTEGETSSLIMTTITEKKWNEIYDDIFQKLWEYCPQKNISLSEAKEIMEEIKKILVEDNETQTDYSQKNN